MGDLFRCRICLEQKAKEEFCRNNRSKLGIELRCKACRRVEYTKNRETIINKIKANYLKNKDQIRAKANAKRSACRDLVNARNRTSRLKSPDRLKYEKSYKLNLKIKAYECLSNKCAVCGLQDTVCLVIDHIYDDGNYERKTGITLIKIYHLILNGSDRYQLLCYNCNMKKSIQVGNLPSRVHKGVNKTCPTCHSDKDVSNFKNDKKYSDGLYYECSVCTRNRGIALKVQAFQRIGSSSCFSCHTSDPDVLTIDHMNEDGFKKRSSEGTGYTLYSNILYSKVNTDNFQVLCLNCNIKKHRAYKSSSGPSSGNYSVKPKRVIGGEQIKEINTTEDFEFRMVVIGSSDDVPEFVKFLESHHYAGYGRYGAIHIGAYLDSKLIAVAKLSNPVRLEVATSMGMSYNELLELDRFCIDPRYQLKNFASYFISRMIKIVRNLRRDIKHLVSFADTAYGHTGIIYKASNWKAVKQVARSYEYLDSTNNVIHKKTVYNRARSAGQKESEYANAVGLKRRYTLRKVKYLYKL